MEGSSHYSWARNLENVLADRSALDAFQEWLTECSSAQYLDLHFAIRAYERMVFDKNPNRTELARTIYSKFLSSKTGNCELIPPRIRSQVGEKIRAIISLPGAELDSRMFESCSEFVRTFLRRQHEEFVHSDKFIEAFNKMNFAEQEMNTIERKKSNGWRKNASQAVTQLTAETLLKSRHDRQTKLGETKLERMYPPARQPYVCNATTSHNDSAVSSSFSGDTPNSHRTSRLRHAKEDQARENATTMTVPRVDHSNRVEGQQFDHFTEHGRKQFAITLVRKLMRLEDKMKMNDETEKKLNDIEQLKYTTLDMIIGTEADDDLERIDEDDELDDYLKRMKDDSQRASANRSPQVASTANDTFSPSREVEKSSRDTVRRLSAANRMTQSMVSYSINSSPHSRTLDYNKISLDAFAPPPMNQTLPIFSSSTMGRSKDGGSQMYDSSGIGSMAPSAFSASSDSSRDRKAHRSHQRNLMMNTAQQFNIGSMPRKHKTRQNMSNLITISYIGPDSVPVVAHVPYNDRMTLSEFRSHFMISERSNSQLFFKTECEDGNAPYQLLLIRDGEQLLPIFEGRITAEMR